MQWPALAGAAASSAIGRAEAGGGLVGGTGRVVGGVLSIGAWTFSSQQQAQRAPASGLLIVREVPE